MSAYVRVGNLTERGAVTLRQMLETYAGHAESHVRQLQQIGEAYRQATGKNESTGSEEIIVGFWTEPGGAARV